MKNIQIIYWGFPLRFGNVKRFKENAAYFLIFKYAFRLGVWEIRKFMTDKEQKKALIQYHKDNVD